MNFKEALIAHLSGEKVEINHPCASYISDERGDFAWRDFSEFFAEMEFRNITLQFGKNYEFRIAPRTITVNGVEVPAPESAPPVVGATYYVPTPDTDVFYSERWNQCEDVTMRHLQRGIVYTRKEDAIARAKAMLLHE